MCWLLHLRSRAKRKQLQKGKQPQSTQKVAEK
jgi:hypothetical protein